MSKAMKAVSGQRFLDFWRQLVSVDVHNLGNAPSTVKVAVLSLLVAAILIFGWLLLIAPAWQNLSALQSAEQVLIDEYAIKYAKANQLNEAKSLQLKQNTELQAQLSRLPKSAQMAQLTALIDSTAQASGVQLVSVTVQPMRAQTYYTQRPLNLSVVGGYHQLGDFLSRLLGGEWLLTVQDYTLTQQLGTSKLQLQMQLSTYQATHKNLSAVVHDTQ